MSKKKLDTANTKFTASQKKILTNLDFNAVGGIGANDLGGVSGHTGIKMQNARLDLERLQKRGFVTKSKFNRTLYTLTRKYDATDLGKANRVDSDNAFKAREDERKSRIRSSKRKNLLGK